MALSLQQVVTVLAELAPPAWAASWDNVGLLLGDGAQPVERILLAIDMTEAVLDEAAAGRANLLVAYHPPWFRPSRNLLGPGGLWRAAGMGLAVYSPHTALDVAEGGTNDVLARAAGLEAWRPLAPLADAPERGQGRCGTLALPVAVPALARRLVQALRARGAQLCFAADALGRVGADDSNDHDFHPGQGRLVRRIALCAGAGGGLLDQAIAAGAEVFVTGELPHHDALRARRAGLDVICLGHATSEAQALPPLASALRARLPDVTVQVAASPAEIWHPMVG